MIERAGPSLETRIAEAASAVSAVIPPRIAQYLENACNMTPDRRIRLRYNDPDAYVVFAALHIAAIRSDTGTNQCAGQQNTSQLEMWLSSREAAKALDVTDRCVRKWCKTGRLHAVMSGSRWLIDPNAIALQNIA